MDQRLIFVLFLHNGKHDYAKAINCGGFEFLPKPDELGSLQNAMNVTLEMFISIEHKDGDFVIVRLAAIDSIRLAEY